MHKYMRAVWTTKVIPSSFSGPCSKDWAPKVLRVNRGSQTSDRGREGCTTEKVRMGIQSCHLHCRSLQGGGEIKTEKDREGAEREGGGYSAFNPLMPELTYGAVNPLMPFTIRRLCKGRRCVERQGRRYQRYDTGQVGWRVARVSSNLTMGVRHHLPCAHLMCLFIEDSRQI